MARARRMNRSARAGDVELGGGPQVANAAAIASREKCAFRPLGLGTTQSRAGPSGSGCGPVPARGRPNAVR